MTADEWEELRSQVDDSFWVMRVIGLLAVAFIRNGCVSSYAGYPPLPNDYDGFSCGEHKSVFDRHLSS